MDVNCWILSGWRGVGKTLFCQSFVQFARREGWDVAGILSPGRFKDGRKVAFDVEAIRSGESKPLAALEQQSPEDLVFSSWFFNRQSLEWANQILMGSFPCDVLIVDELGPLEFKRSAGFQKAFEAIHSRAFKLALVVIRPELVEQACQVFPVSRVLEIQTADDGQNLLRQYAPEWRKMIRPLE